MSQNESFFDYFLDKLFQWIVNFLLISTWRRRWQFLFFFVIFASVSAKIYYRRIDKLAEALLSTPEDKMFALQCETASELVLTSQIPENEAGFVVLVSKPGDYAFNPRQDATHSSVMWDYSEWDRFRLPGTDIILLHYLLAAVERTSKKLNRCVTYVEWGTGRHTKLALEYVSRAISIENNPARCYNLLNDPEAKESINTGKLLLACIPEQIGSNISEKSRNLQAEKYVNALDNFDDNFTADFIFVGGNYKVATALNCLKRLSPNGMLYFFGFYLDSSYWILSNFYEELKLPAHIPNVQSAILIKKQDIDELKVQLILDVWSTDPR